MSPHVAGFVGTTLGIVVLAALRRPRLARPIGTSTVSARRTTSAPSWVQEAARTLNVGIDPATAWALLCGVAVVASLVAIVSAGLVLGLFAIGSLAVAGPPAGRRLIAWQAARRRDAQLPLALERLASEVRGGSTLGVAITAVSSCTPAPLGLELGRVAEEITHGSGVVSALDRWARRHVATPHIKLAADALALAADAGGEVARSIDRVAATLRERREVQAEARALATQARASAAVLAVAPPVFTLLVASVEPTALQFLLTSPPGRLCLLGGVALEIGGAAWMARIVRGVA